MKLHKATHTVIALALAAGFGMSAAVAQEKQMPSQRFLQFDKDRNGFITKDEVKGTRWFEQSFDMGDDNKDGKLDQAEFIKADSIQDRMAGGNYVSDTVLKTKIKAVLLKERGLKSRDLDVEVVGGEVLLSGFIRNEDQRNLALKAATSVKGVAGVRDAMVVK